MQGIRWVCFWKTMCKALSVPSWPPWAAARPCSPRSPALPLLRASLPGMAPTQLAASPPPSLSYAPAPAWPSCAQVTCRLCKLNHPCGGKCARVFWLTLRKISFSLCPCFLETYSGKEGGKLPSVTMGKSNSCRLGLLLFFY